MVVLVTTLAIALHLNGSAQGQAGALVAVGASLLWLVPGALWIGHRTETQADLDKRCCGMRHVGTALGDMWRHYPELLKLVVAWMLAASAMSSTITLSTTHLQFYLGFSSRTTSLLLAPALLAAVPGAFLAKPLTRWLGLKNAFAAVNLAYGVSYALAPLLLVSEPSATPRDSKLSIYGRCDNATLVLAGSAAESLGAGLGPRVAPKYVLHVSGAFVLLWGLGIGVVYPLTNALTAVMVPGGRETSLLRHQGALRQAARVAAAARRHGHQRGDRLAALRHHAHRAHLAHSLAHHVEDRHGQGAPRGCGHAPPAPRAV